MENRIRGRLVTRKGEFVYEYFIWYDKNFKADIYAFEIWSEDPECANLHKFSFILMIMENGRDLKVIDLIAAGYKGKGISIPMILKAKELFNKRIISSSNTHKSYHGEANWKEAIDKVWEPMVAQKIAAYDAMNDYYYVL